MQGGLTTLYATNVTGNSARQQGGGIAFANICGSSSSCALNLLNGSAVEANSAQSGGGVFIAVPGNTGANKTQLAAAAPADKNTAVYSGGVSMAPSWLGVNRADVHVPSSTGVNGLIPLEARVGQGSIRVLVEFCDLYQNDRAYLTGVVEKSGADRNGTTQFRTLRLLAGTTGRSYCLMVGSDAVDGCPRLLVSIIGGHIFQWLPPVMHVARLVVPHHPRFQKRSRSYHWPAHHLGRE
jgi:hypothetical protein